MKALKVVLVVVGVVCLFSSLPGAVVPWSVINRVLGVLGFRAVPELPLVVYCVRLSALGFALMGVFFLLLATDPVRYQPMLALGTWGLVVMGVLAFETGRMVGMQPPWYWADGGFAVLAGVLILIFWPRAQQAQE